MKNIFKIFVLFYCLTGNINGVHSKSEPDDKHSFSEKLKVVKLLIDTQQYSQAMLELKSIEKDNALEIKTSLKNEVDYRLMVSRVLRLSYQFDDAMNQMNLLPDLSKEPKFKLDVDFRKAALYMENPKYSMEERVKIVYPIIDEGIRVSQEINSVTNLASFYNLKAAMHFEECAYLKVDCDIHRRISAEIYKKAMDLFLSINDTSNYHNSLNGLFKLAIVDKRPEVDSIKKIVVHYANTSTYFPNLTISRSLLGQYFVQIKNDSLSYFRQTILEKNAMIDAVNNNADNTIEKLKLLYEFDSLKADLELNKDVVLQKDLVIQEKNKRITDSVIYGIVLALLILILVIVLIKQKVLTKSIKNTNIELNKSNYNYQLLIKESNHRIKNNLQMILSIIELDKEDADRESQKILTSISSKILTISALHKILDFKEHNQKVELQTYFNEIIQYFKDLTKYDVVFETDFAVSQIQSERIVYFGLLLNEMISNTLKHRKSNDIIIIQILKSNKSYIFNYRDNSDFGDFEKNNGIFLIENLINRSGGRDLKFNSKYGEYKFYFNE